MGTTGEMMKRAVGNAAKATAVSATLDVAMVPFRELFLKLGVPEETLDHPEVQKLMKVAVPALIHLAVSMGEEQLDKMIGEGRSQLVLKGTSIAIETSMTEVGFHLMDKHVMPFLKVFMLGAGQQFMKLGSQASDPHILSGSPEVVVKSS